MAKNKFLSVLKSVANTVPAKDRDIIYDYEDEDFNEYEYDDNYIPVGCRACGGDYPNCTEGCPLFDD